MFLYVLMKYRLFFRGSVFTLSLVVLAVFLFGVRSPSESAAVFSENSDAVALGNSLYAGQISYDDTSLSADSSVVELDSPGAEFVGTVDVFGEIHSVWRNFGGVTGRYLTFGGNQGRDVDLYSVDSVNWSGSFDVPAGSYVGILCPWYSTVGSNEELGACLGFVDFGGTGNGAVVVAAYETPGTSMLVDLSLLNQPDGANVWFANLPLFDYSIYYDSSQDRFLFKDLKGSESKLTTTNYYGSYWSELSNHQGLLEVRFVPLADGKETISIEVIFHATADYWASSGKVLETPTISFGGGSSSGSSDSASSSSGASVVSDVVSVGSSSVADALEPILSVSDSSSSDSFIAVDSGESSDTF